MRAQAVATVFFLLLPCSLGAKSAVECWGDNSNGKVGKTPEGGNVLVPFELSGFTSRVLVMASGDQVSCVLLEVGEVHCWGSNTGGALGRGSATPTSDPVPANVTGLLERPVDLACGYAHCCVISASRRVQCWGRNADLEVGPVEIGVAVYSPTNFLPLPDQVESIVCGDVMTCAILVSGDAYCWGRYTNGRLGDGGSSTADRFIGPKVVFSERPKLLANANDHVCALMVSGKVFCWGSSAAGQVGTGTNTATNNIPLEVTLPAKATHVSAGGSHTCAVLVNSDLYCWGSNAFRQLGTASTASTNLPTGPILSGVRYVAAGREHTCALTVSGDLYCWGRNQFGQLGNNGATANEAASAPLVNLVGKAYDLTGTHRTHVCLLVSCCPKDEYTDVLPPFGSTCPSTCYSCDTCPPGEGAAMECSAGNNTVCEMCTNNSYSPIDSHDPCFGYSLCNAGTYYAGGNSTNDRECVPCPGGTFSDAVNQAECSPCGTCSAGYETASACSATSNVSCLICSNGTASAGGISCTPCGAEEFAPEGSSTCLPCALPARTVTNGGGACECSPGFGGPSCNPCPIGFYKPEVGDHACTACPLHRNTVADATVLEADCLCDRGYYEVGVNCAECNLNSYKAMVSNGPCSSCPPTKVTTRKGGRSVADCDECISNHYGPSCALCQVCSSGGQCDDGITGTGNCSCSNTTGWHGPMCDECTDLDWFGPYCNQSCTCNVAAGDCIKGLNGTGVCYSCFSDDTLGINCDQCKPGRLPFGPDNLLCLKCPKGSETVLYEEIGCSLCPEGEFQPLDAQDVVCEACPAGTAAAGTGNAECTNCGYGFNQSLPGQTSCSSCGLGSTTASATSAYCTPCVDLQSWAASSLSSCAACKDACGCFPGEERLAGNCSTCPSGTFKAGFGDGPCAQCAAHSVSFPGSTECSPCPQSPDFMYVSSDRTQCLCLPGFYLNLEGVCVECPEGATCDGAFFAPLNIAGYHCSFDAEGGEPTFHKCPPSAGEGACLDNCQCAEWHDPTSLGCTACLPGSYRPATSDDLRCKECPKFPLAALIIVCVTLTVLGSAGLIYIARRSKAFFPSLIVGLNFIQIISVLAHFSIKWPPVLENFFMFLSVFTIDISIVHPECAFPKSNAYPTIWFLKFFTPFFVLTLFLISYVVIAIVCYYKFHIPPEAVGTERATWEKNFLANMYAIDLVGRQQTFKNKRDPWLEHLRDFRYNLTNAFLTMLSVIYLVTALTTMEIFVCTRVESSDGTTSSALDESPTIRCNPGQDSTYALLLAFAIIGLFMYVIGIPLSFFAILYRNRYRLGQAPVVAKFGLLYRRYSLKTYYWDVVITMRKLAVVVARSFLAAVPILQVLVCLAVAVTSMVATRKLAPFLSPRINKLENTCLACAVVILLVGLIYGSIAEAKDGDPSKGWEVGSTLLGVVCILIWAACMVFVIATFYVDLTHLRKRLKHGIPDDDGDDDVQTMEEFYLYDVRIKAYHKILSRANKQSQQQVRIVFTVPEHHGFQVGMRFSTLVEYLAYHKVDATGNISPSISENLDDSAFDNVPSNVLIQTQTEGDRKVYMMDMLMPFPDQFAMEIFVRPSEGGASDHILHLIVNADDSGGPAPGGGKVVHVSKEFPARDGIIFTPTQAVLIADASVAFRCQAPGAKTVYVQRSIREEAQRDTTENDPFAAMLSTLNADSDDGEAAGKMQELLEKQEQYKAKLRAKTVAVKSVLDTVGASKSMFVSDSVRISSGDRFEMIAVYEVGGKEEKVTIANYSAISAEEVLLGPKKKPPPAPAKKAAPPRPAKPPKSATPLDENPLFDSVTSTDARDSYASEVELDHFDPAMETCAVCELCEVDPVEMYCDDCFLSFCSVCCTRYHRAKSRRNHTFGPL